MASKIVKIKVTAEIVDGKLSFIDLVGGGNRIADEIGYALDGNSKLDALVNKHFPGFRTDGTVDVLNNNQMLFVSKKEDGGIIPASQWKSKKKAFIADLAKLIGSLKIDGVKRVTS